jgi:hypothetical protein
MKNQQFKKGDIIERYSGWDCKHILKHAKLTFENYCRGFGKKYLYVKESDLPYLSKNFRIRKKGDKK